MNKKQIEDLFNEMINSSGLINLDANDILAFKKAVNDFDGEKLKGTNEEVGKLLSQAIDSIKKRHEGQKFTHLLLSVNASSDETFMMEHLNGVNEVFSIIDLECAWQLVVDKELHGNELTITVIMGF